MYIEEILACDTTTSHCFANYEIAQQFDFELNNLKKYHIPKLIFLEWDATLVKWKFGMERTKKKLFKMLVYISSVILAGNLIFTHHLLEFKGSLADRPSKKNLWACMTLTVGSAGFSASGLKQAHQPFVLFTVNKSRVLPLSPGSFLGSPQWSESRQGFASSFRFNSSCPVYNRETQ